MRGRTVKTTVTATTRIASRAHHQPRPELAPHRGGRHHQVRPERVGPGRGQREQPPGGHAVRLQRRAHGRVAGHDGVGAGLAGQPDRCLPPGRGRRGERGGSALLAWFGPGSCPGLAEILVANGLWSAPEPDAAVEDGTEQAMGSAPSGRTSTLKALRKPAASNA